MEPELIESVRYEGGPVDIEVVMEQIRGYLAKKQGATRTRASVETSASRILAPETYDDLYQANEAYDKLYVAPYLTPVRIPLVGALWQKLRGALHSIAVFYVNRLAEAQMRFNGHTVRVLNEIVRGLDADATPDKVVQLEQRVRALEAELMKREQQSGAPDETRE
jgi:hypothetical protein